MERVMKLVLTGNVLLIFCCVFYLLWWILAFHPSNAVKGMKSGWLLLPAAVSGVSAIAVIVRGICTAHIQRDLIPAGKILLVSVAAYFILLAGTWLLLKRPVTTELLLIVGWTALILSEINTLFGIERFTRPQAAGFMTAVIISAAISLAAYLVYYRLGAVSGYIDGMIPLILIAIMMVILSVKIR